MSWFANVFMLNCQEATEFREEDSTCSVSGISDCIFGHEGTALLAQYIYDSSLLLKVKAGATYHIFYEKRCLHPVVVLCPVLR